MSSVVVVGAGVAGLTTSLVLAQKGYKVTVVAKHMPGDLSIEYTSPWAVSPPSGGKLISGSKLVICGSFIRPAEEGYDEITYPILWDLASHHPEAGIETMSCVEYHDVPLLESGVVRKGESQVWFKDFVHDFREIPPEELPACAKAGFSLTTVSINPQIYLPYLQSQLLRHGAQFVRRNLSHIAEAFSLATPSPSAVVNATGISAGKLGGVLDKNVYPTRGQTILVANTCSKMYFRSGDRMGKEPTYIIPRAFGGGTILGGCRQPDNWSGDVDHDLASRIAAKCAALAPELTGGKGVEGLEILRHNVGLRPSRTGGPRLEAENMRDVGLIVHNYGASGAGYQSSWGMALKAADILEEALAAKDIEVTSPT